MTDDWRTWALGSAFFAAWTAILTRLGVTQTPSHLATALRTSVVVLMAWGFAWKAKQLAVLPILTPKTHLLLVLSGLATGASWLCYFRALQLAPVTKVAPLDKLSLPFSLLLAVLVLGERIGLREGCGIAAIMGGTVLLIGK